MRTGEEYLERLRDGRDVWLEGERVKDVTSDPRLGASARSVARLYDRQHDPDVAETMVSQTPDGRTIGTSFVEPRSAADLTRRRAASKTWLDMSGGTMGRGPDFMNIHMTALASGADFFAQGGERFGENIRAYYERMSAEDLCLTHVLANPQTDRSKAVSDVPQDTAAKIVEERPDGVVIRGARMVGTLAPYSDEIAVFPSSYLRMDDAAKAYAYAFAIPVATPGLRLICRPTLSPPGARTADFPLSSRFDEMDAVVIFDDVLVPWDRLFIHGDPELANGVFGATGTGAQISHHGAIRVLAKAEFVLGVAYSIAEAIGIEGFDHVQAKIAEIITIVEVARACLVAAEAGCQEGPGGTVLPNGEALWGIRSLGPTFFPRMAEILQLLGASGYMSPPSAAELEGERGDDVRRYYQAATLPADRRIELFRLAWDLCCSSFAGRQVLYERFSGGDPWRLATGKFKSYGGRQEAMERVTRFLDETRAASEAEAVAR